MHLIIFDGMCVFVMLNPLTTQYIKREKDTEVIGCSAVEGVLTYRSMLVLTLVFNNKLIDENNGLSQNCKRLSLVKDAFYCTCA